MRRIAVVALVLAVACGGPPADHASPGDTGAAQDTTPAAPQAPEWGGGGRVDYRRERAVDFTGDGIVETVIATAFGPSYDSLDVAITIVSEAGDTLWRETWPSLLYFQYDPLEGKADSTVMRIVRDHVEQLLEPARITREGGLPPVLRQGGDPESVMREALRYHLAELDWRRANGVPPGAPTGPEAWSAIDAEAVTEERVAAVLEEVRTRPSLMYYAGGEATYVIAWSSQENAFVRIYSCC